MFLQHCLRARIIVNIGVSIDIRANLGVCMYECEYMFL